MQSTQFFFALISLALFSMVNALPVSNTTFPVPAAVLELLKTAHQAPQAFKNLGALGAATPQVNYTTLPTSTLQSASINAQSSWTPFLGWYPDMPEGWCTFSTQYVYSSILSNNNHLSLNHTYTIALALTNILQYQQRRKLHRLLSLRLQR